MFSDIVLIIDGYFLGTISGVAFVLLTEAGRALFRATH